MDFRVITDFNAVIDRNVWMNAHPISYYDILPDRHMGIDENFLGNAGARINYRGGIPVRLEICSGLKNNQRASKGEVRIFRAQDCQVRTLNLRVFTNVNR